MALTVTFSDIAAFLALAVALWSAVQTGRFNQRQNEFAETAEKLNSLLIAREAAETDQRQRAEVSANFVRIGKGNYRLKLFNRGMASARNVRLEVLEGESLFGRREFSEKFPFPILERQQHVDMIVFVGMGSPRRAHLRITWDDDAGQDQSADIWRDVY